MSELKNGTYDLEKNLRFKEWNSFTSFLSFMHFVNFHIVAHKNIAKTLLHLSFIQERQGLAILMTIELWYLHNLKPNSVNWLKIFQFPAWWWEGWWWLIRSFKDLSFLWMMMKKTMVSYLGVSTSSRGRVSCVWGKNSRIISTFSNNFYIRIISI